MEITQTVSERILEFSWFAFNQRGFRKTSMDMVARELRISKKTIYKYFASKEQLLEDCLQRRFDAFEKRIPEVLVPEDRGEAFFRFFNLYSDYSDDISALLRDEIRNEIPYLEERIVFFENQAFRKRMGAFLKALRTSKTIDYPSPTREFSAALLGAMKGLKGQAPEKVRFLLDVFAAGIKVTKSKSASGKGAASKSQGSKAKKKKKK